MNRRVIKWMSLAAVLVAVASIVCVGIRNESLNPYGYDVRADYRYDFSENVASTAVKIDKDSFTLPEISSGCDTAVLRIRVKATLSGEILAPYVEMENADASNRQYFERGVRGVRYINISSFLGNHPKADSRIILRCHGMALDAKEGILYLFSNPKPETVRILLVSPHPDDAEIAAFGLYSHRDAHIVTITAGEGGMDTYEHFLEHEDAQSRRLIKGRLRVLDSVFTPLIGGIEPERSVNLGYFDGTLNEMHAFPAKEAVSRHVRTGDITVFRKYAAPLAAEPPSSRWQSLVADLKQIVSTTEPDIVVSPHPLLDTHPDHQYATLAVFEAIQSLRLKNLRFYLYVNHIQSDRAYPFGPPQSITSLPPAFDPVQVSGLYSFNLTAREATEKKLALEAMHGLRSPDDWAVTDLQGLVRVWGKSLKSYVAAKLGYGYSYSRRALKANELFFVCNYADAGALKEEFLRKATVDKVKPSPGE